MASSKHKRDNNEYDPPTFSSVTPHFFIVVLHNTLQDNKLIMPKKFVSKYGKTLSNEAFVKLSCGSEWEIELRKSDGLVWFQKGWPDFAKHYSIGFGHFIIFKYKGNSRFDAIIFDKSTVEIDYPIVPFRCDEPNNTEESEDRKNSVQILEKPSPSSRKRKSSESRIYRSRKKFRAGPIDETCLRPKWNHDQYNVDSHRAKTKTKGKVSFSADQQGEAGKSVTAKHGKFDAFRKANNFESAENFTYNVIMKASHVSKTYEMTLPSDFARKFLTRNKSYTAFLKLVDGRTWPACFRCRSTHDDKIRDAIFTKFSWKKFSRDNDLKVGDTCGFELIDRKTMLFKVSIFKGESSAVNSVHLPKYLGDSRAFEAAVRFSSTNPFFILTLKPASFRPSQRVPASFCRAYFEKLNKVITLMLGTHSWSVNVYFFPPHSFRFSGGWLTFVRENSLCVGDVCVFELINTNHIVLKVTIFRVNGCSRGKSSVLRQRKPEAVTTQEVTAKNRTKLQRANGFESNNFTYKIVMTRTHVIKPYDINLPSRFARKFLDNETRSVILKTADGRTWPVTLHSRGRGRSRRARLDKTAWKKFSLDNKLKLGDNCTFELIDESKLLLEVSISRARDDSHDHPSHGTGSKWKRNRKIKPEFDYPSDDDTTSRPPDQNASGETRGKYFRRGNFNGTRSSSAFEAASRFSSPNPFFIKAITLASVKGTPVIRIPTKFARICFQQQRRQTVMLKLGTNSWNANVLCIRARYYSFTGCGWMKFARENSLNAGDVCVYELIEEIDDRVVLKVSVFRAIGD